MAQAVPVNDESLSAQTYHALRTGIIVGRYEPGSALKEHRLAEELEVSRIPIRSAIMQLDHDGFLVTAPRRSARVAAWTERSINELFDVRLSLEGLAARLAAQNAADGASADVLAEALAEAHRAVDGGDRLAIAEAHARFHQTIVELADSGLLSTLMRAVGGRMTWMFYLTGTDRDPGVQSHEHDELLDAIAAGNARLAESLAFSHIEKGRAPSLGIILGDG
ncbi:GntR family transcriptional regulator [Agromyces sp. MMS24-K17]|uniref:GntR family transcriptional regulator n=1 Tax=Agromyces sp. MMS24-K17 TaxID=3372850 RepID=UPI003754BCB1